MTRENSPDNMNDGESDAEARDDQVIVGAPMASLFKVTRLRNIRSDPGSHRHGPVTSDRGQPMDFIDEDRACLADAEKLFTTFKGTLNAYLWGGVRYHNLDDIRGLCIGAFWLSDVSWKLSGLAVRIATELNIHQSCAKALRGDAAHFEKARLWYVLYVCDHHFSIAYGRPPVINEDMTITNHQAFLDLPGATKSDIRLHSQVGIFMILSRVDCSFGPDRSRLVANDEFESIRRYGADIDQWRRKWEQRLERQEFINVALKSASSALHLILEDPDIRKAVVGVPLYLLTTVSHASIFLMKVHSKWRSANFQVGFHEIVHLIEAIVVLLDDTRGCSRHVNQYIANGLRSMLEKFRRWETSNELQMQAPANDSNMLLGWNESRQGWGTETDWGFGGAGLSDQFGFGSDYYHMDLLGILGSQMPES
uniref:Xylanolytic transcriptional activator regulatory domain-containing protein n=1 Tax=Bionectria ochroleuca TaxID=29856 RepID=A0A0B7K4U7_BIOOC